MSIDLEVVCMRQPDLRSSEAFAAFVCAAVLVRDDFADVFVYEGKEGEHEFDGEYLVSLSPRTREPRSFLAQVVLGSAMCVLYDGRLIDDLSFFPSLDPCVILHRCSRSPFVSPDDVWTDLLSLRGT